MKHMTENNLKDAFAGESQAHMKYLNFAARARKDGMENVARLFEAASLSEQIHASKHLKVLGGIGSTSENLEAAAGGEGFEIDEMYPAYIAVAEAQGESAAQKSMSRAFEAEKVHKKLYEAAKASADAGTDADVPQLHVCLNCGFTMEGETPDTCPVCGVSKSRFQTF